jgi:hypothetical protein
MEDINTFIHNLNNVVKEGFVWYDLFVNHSPHNRKYKHYFQEK